MLGYTWIQWLFFFFFYSFPSSKKSVFLTICY